MAYLLFMLHWCWCLELLRIELNGKYLFCFIVKKHRTHTDASSNDLAGSQSPRAVVVDDDDDSDDDNIRRTPQRRVPAVPTFNSPNLDDSSLVVKGI